MKNTKTGTKSTTNVDAANNSIIGKFADINEARAEGFTKMQYGGPNPTQPVAAVINDYSKKKPYGQPGGPSYVSRNPAPAFKKGGAKKK